jgi:hypothetical protein
MFIGHIAAALAGKRAAPRASLGTWVAAVLFVDMLWSVFLLAGFEHVRITPGITAFTPLDFYDYPISHSLVSGVVWAVLFASLTGHLRADTRTGLLLAGGVLSHWVLDVVSHRPDVPVLPSGPYVGLGLWNSVPATLVVELSLFAAALAAYARGCSTRPRFWIFITALLVIYFANAFGPPPPDERSLAFGALTMWLLVPWAAWIDRK